MDLKRVKALRKAIDGATLNDVILSILCRCPAPLSGGKGRTTRQATGGHGAGINPHRRRKKMPWVTKCPPCISNWLRTLKTRSNGLEKIHINTLVGKLYQDAIDARSLMGFAELIPFGLAGVAARFYTRSAIAKHHNPFFNLVITNVPGPQFPVYLAGHKLLVNMGTAPIFDGMGLIMPIFSYNGTLSISPTSASNLMPDLDDFTRYLRESANELEAAVEEKMKSQAAFRALLEEK